MLFANNYNGVFSERADLSNGRFLDNYVASLFSRMKPGGRLVTLWEMSCLGESRSKRNEIRRSRNLPPSDDASFFEVETHVLNHPVAEWSKGDITVYVYTKVKQSGNNDWDPVHICGAGGCRMAEQGFQVCPIQNEEKLLDFSCDECARKKEPTKKILARPSTEEDETGVQGPKKMRGTDD